MTNTELENKLTALKIGGEYIETLEDNSYIYHYIQFDESITINRIKSRLQDLGVFFGANVSLYIDGTKTALQVKKQERNSVYFSDYQTDLQQATTASICIGELDDGRHFIQPINKLPHLLVAGSTGSGKSVFLNNCILSLILGGKSELILIDVKRVEFSVYNGLNCLKYPVVTEIDEAQYILNIMCEIMDNRYKELTRYNCRDIDSYNQKVTNNKYNYITIIIDELADLILQSSKEFERCLVRLASLGRACGIFLIVATQRPSCEVVTGLIKQNIPSRVCFHVADKNNSRIILDAVGGEALKGSGDGIFKNSIGESVHFQAPFISDLDIQQFVDNLKRKY